MVKKNIFKNKKAMLVETMIAWIFAILAIGIAMFFATTSNIGQNDILQDSAPVIQYQYPILYLNTFLNQDLIPKEIKEVGLDENKKYKIKDIIRFWEKSEVLDLLENKRSDYIIEQADEKDGSLRFYKNTAIEKVDENNLLIFTKVDESELNMKIEDCTRDVQNYCFYFKTDNQDYVIVSFEKITHKMTQTELNQARNHAWTRGR